MFLTAFSHLELNNSYIYRCTFTYTRISSDKGGIREHGRRSKRREVKIIKALRFADDQAMLAGSESDLQRMMDRLNMVSVNYNMKLNTKKTKATTESKGSEEAQHREYGAIGGLDLPEGRELN